MGMWPFQERKRFSSLIYLDIAMICGILLMVMKLITDKFDLDSVIDLLPTLTVLLTIQGNSLNLRFRFKMFCDLWLRIKNDWNEARIEEESKIKHFYAKRSQTITFCVFIAIIGETISLLIVNTFYSKILDIFFPVNETRRPKLYVEVEAFLDHDKYFYVYACFVNIIIISCLFLFAVHFSLFQVFFLHVCGMFSILGYRMQHAISKETLEQLDKSDLNEIYYQTIILYIERYKNAVKFVKQLESYFAPIFILGLTLSITMFAPSFYKLSNPKMDSIKPVFDLIFGLSYALISSVFGQILINITAELSNNIHWERCSVSVQKVLPLIINATGKQVEFTGIKLYRLSLPFFRMMLHVAVSYYLVLKQFG
ncbi:odorant receptor 13a-like isoform X2 [Prorops nasuta]|uniref:odorant receptor 13a-like isoform X2 n=1 Tax=Prorops nasuta TaxID=863751 RepID=UPI0034CE8D67